MASLQLGLGLGVSAHGLSEVRVRSECRWPL